MEKSAFSPVLLYHAVYDEVPIPLRNRIHNVQPGHFCKQIKWLKANFDIVPVARLPPGRNTGCVSITFDDANESVFSNAIPILDSMSIPATIFPIGNTLSGGLFWRDKLRFIVHAGLERPFMDYAVQYLGMHPAYFNGGLLLATKQGPISDILIDEASNRFIADVMGEFPTLPWHAPVPHGKSPSETLSFGNHTYSHFRQSILSREMQQSEIDKGESAIQRAFGACEKILALPFGRIRDAGSVTHFAALKSGYKSILYCEPHWYGPTGWMKHHSSGGLVEINRMKAPDSCLELQNRFGNGFGKNRMGFPYSNNPQGWMKVRKFPVTSPIQ